MSKQVDKIIAELGGSTAVSRLVDKGVSTVSNWKRDGLIPCEYWPRFSKALGRKLPMAAFSFDRKPARNSTTSQVIADPPGTEVA